jgi:hypothetical protein
MDHDSAPNRQAVSYHYLYLFLNRFTRHVQFGLAGGRISCTGPTKSLGRLILDRRYIIVVSPGVSKSADCGVPPLLNTLHHTTCHLK